MRDLYVRQCRNKNGSGRKDVAFKRIVLYFYIEEIESEEMYQKLSNNFGFYHHNKNNGFSIHRLLEILLSEEENNHIHSNEYKKTLLNLLLLTILRQSKPEIIKKATDRINRIINYIHNNYMNDLSLEVLSDIFFISKYHLSREFKKRTSKTVVQYINKTRIMHAERKIMETKKSLTKISHETGFSSLTHFNRVFKSITNLTPSEYRKIYLYKKKNSLA